MQMCPSSRSSKFSGFKSRYSTPDECRYSRPLIMEWFRRRKENEMSGFVRWVQILETLNEDVKEKEWVILMLTTKSKSKNKHTQKKQLCDLRWKTMEKLSIFKGEKKNERGIFIHWISSYQAQFQQSRSAREAQGTSSHAVDASKARHHWQNPSRSKSENQQIN